MRGVQTSPETQERVRQAAEELGYTGNAVARALARGSTGLVGVLSGSLQDLSEQRFVETLGRELGGHDLHMVVVDARGEPERERMLARQLADQLVDGLIISPLDPSDAVVGRHRRDAPDRDRRRRARRARRSGEVLFDNRAGVGLVLEHLHALGHRRIAVLTPSRPSTPDRPAERVVAELCDALGLEATVVNSRAFDRGGDGGRGRAAGARPAPDRGLLPLGLDRLRRVRGRGRARAWRSRATSRSPATTATRSPASSSPPLTSVELGAAGRRRLRGRAARRRRRRAPEGARRGPASRVAPELVERGSTAAPAVVPA